MFKKGIKILTFIVLANAFNFVIPTKVNAASASLSVKVNKSTVIVGSTVTATVTVSSGTALGSWQFDVGYDSSMLQLTNSSFGNGAHVADVYKSAGQKSASYTFTFKALKSGNATISTKNAGIYAENAQSASDTMSVTHGSKTVKLMTQAELEATYSKNNYLKSLSVEGAELSPAFNKETLEYTVELEPETTNIKVNAAKEDGKASITGTGDIAVSEGDNNIKITVTAENGNERVYVINAKVKELAPINVKVGKDEFTVIRKKGIIETPNTYKETTIKINNEDVPAFESEITGFILVGLKDNDGNVGLYLYDTKKDTYTKYTEINSSKVVIYPMEIPKDIKIPEGYNKYPLKIGEEEFEVYRISKGSQFSLIYGLNIETGKKNLYLYDSKEETLQRYYDGEVEKKDEIIKNYSMFLIGSGGLILVLCIILIILCVKLVKKNNNKVMNKQKTVNIPKKDPREKEED